jgi:hypothetical protein
MNIITRSGVLSAGAAIRYKKWKTALSPSEAGPALVEVNWSVAQSSDAVEKLFCDGPTRSGEIRNVRLRPRDRL